MGQFKFTGYNKAYMEETARKVSLPIAQKIYAARWKLVRAFCDSGTLLDYGCACGAFHLSAPHSFNCTGWDVNPDSPFAGRAPHGHFDVLTLWDVVEHLPSPLEPTIRHTPDLVFITTPDAADTNLWEFGAWKHYKPIEHLYYFTAQTLTMSMASVGYKLLHVDHVEGGLRDPSNPNAILTAVYANA